MCQFFSFVGDGYGNYLYSDWNVRKNNLDENTDSHTWILTSNKVPADKQDRWSKYEYNPLTKDFVIDQPVEGHEHNDAESWVNRLDFKTIVPTLIIKPIKKPLTKKVKFGDSDIENLKNWASARASVVASVGDSARASVGEAVRESGWASVVASVGDSVRDSVWEAVRESVWASVVASVGDSVREAVWEDVRESVWASVVASVGDSVRDSVWESVWASVVAYYSSFFDIQYKYDFLSLNKLWESGLVPSFDGKIWRLHTGKKAVIVYEWTPEVKK